MNTDITRITYDKLTSTSNSISINSMDLYVGGKVLFKNTNLTISPNQIYGLIGKNGSGKSSILKQIISLQNTIETLDDSVKINCLYVEQEIVLDQRNPIDFILDSNFKLKNMNDELNKLEINMNHDSNDMERIKSLYNTINCWNPELERVNVIKILKGLGFTEKMLIDSSNILSGGWVMRMSLARSLYLEPNILLLDEPTNHLDMEAIVWLGDYLNSWNKTVIVVSHNIGFLNDICDHIINIEDNMLVYYKGNYHAFKSAYNFKFTEMKKKWEKYEKSLKDIKKKGDKKIVESYIKKHHINRPALPYNMIIDFIEPSMIRSNLISMNNVSFGYVSPTNIIKNFTYGFDINSKIILVGPNGCGKSTLVRLILGEIKPISGTINIHPQCTIGYYNQHFEHALPPDLTPIEYIMKICPDINIIRKNFGKIKLDSVSQTKKINELSGGMKARVALVYLILLKPHFLILDEPTNHLDIETIEALIEGLTTFKGGMIIITHERELIDRIDGIILNM